MKRSTSGWGSRRFSWNAMIDDERTFEFVKIVERFPDIYKNKDNHAVRYNAHKSWQKVAKCVKEEMNIDCAAIDLKTRWKGIRSSFTRYRLNRIRKDGTGKHPPKKYYLYDALRFLIPYTKSNKMPKDAEGDPVNYESSDEVSNSNDNGDDQEPPTWYPVEINTIKTEEQPSEEDDEEPIATNENKRKRRHSSTSAVEADNEDLTFFKSILPDISKFTSKEKRRLKMGVLQLIDTIDSERDGSK